jgi:hypothetical protein
VSEEGGGGVSCSALLSALCWGRGAGAYIGVVLEGSPTTTPSTMSEQLKMKGKTNTVVSREKAGSCVSGSAV